MASSEAPEIRSGIVHLVGAGPGDPELLTLKARRLISEADAIVYDALVDPAVLEWARPGCELIFAGKRCGRPQWRQQQIDAELVRLAGHGKTVVRLKGGDPLVFGRASEEAAALAKAGVAFTVVPGVTAALGAAAAAGIGLTHRHLSSAVVLLTGHEDPAKGPPTVRWEEHARSGATLCIYMGVHHLDAIAGRLQAAGMSGDTPAALIERAATPAQRILRAPLCAISGQAQLQRFESPALAIIGAVTAPEAALGFSPPPQA